MLVSCISVKLGKGLSGSAVKVAEGTRRLGLTGSIKTEPVKNLLVVWLAPTHRSIGTNEVM